MPTGSTTTTSVAPTNPALNQLFTGMFGSAGPTGISTLSNITGGQNVQQLNAALTQSNSGVFASNIAKIKESFGANGMGSSSALATVLGQAATQNASDLTSQIATADLTATGQQLSAAQYLTSIFSQSANEYYTNKSSKSDSGMSTFINLFSSLFPGGL